MRTSLIERPASLPADSSKHSGKHSGARGASDTAAAQQQRREPADEPVALPDARGPRSEFVLTYLRGRPTRLPLINECDPFDDDLQLALHLCYELHYTGLPRVKADLEWDPTLLAVRAVFEQIFLRGMADIVGAPRPVADAKQAIRTAVDSDDGPSVSRHMAAIGTLGQMLEFVVHRSAYQLKEADPHTWALPRLTGDAKRALAAIQAGEYGVGEAAWMMHAELFATTMRALGLDARRNAHLGRLPGATLATGNLMSLFGLHRRWRHALVGNLTVLEMTSVEPMGRYAAALSRLGAPPEARRFYEVHVVADREHEEMALDEMVAALVHDEPNCTAPLLFGVRCALAVERAFADHLLTSWCDGRSSLRPLPLAG